MKMCATEKVRRKTDEFQMAIDSEPAQGEVLTLACVDTTAVTCAQAHLENRPSFESESTTPHYDEVLAEEFVESNTNEKIDDPLFSLKSEKPDSDFAGSLSSLSETFLKTYIVGRKFSDVTEIISGTSIYLLRDPDNVKDPNAIKVIFQDSGGQKVLGYLPRELAQYLSPLIDKYQLDFKGVITSVPKNPTDFVPIEIVYQGTPSYIEVANDDLPELRSLCENVFHLTSSGLKYPPSTAKYQHNFSCMIKEVLDSSVHLFTDDEKLFLDSFSSMSDDGQRLFVRLYTRKGPWFHISNLSYPEIQDYKAAVDELSEASYARSFRCGSEVDEMDLKEILRILSVNELCEMMSILKKAIRDSKTAKRKMDIIAVLHSSFKDGLCPSLPNLVLDRTGTCIRISSIAELLLWRVQRLFFLDGEQDLSAFLLVDLGLVKYPEYKCIISDPVFSTRNEFLAYEEAIEVAQMMDQSLDDEDSKLVLQCIEIAEYHLSSHLRMKSHPLPTDSAESEASFRKTFSASWVYSKVAFLGVSYHEQGRRYHDAIKLLKLLLNNFTVDGRRGYWTLRLSVDLEHLGCIEESLSVAEDGVLDPWVRAGSKMALQKRVIRLGKPPRRWKSPTYADAVKRKIIEVHIQGRPLSSNVGIKSRFYGEDGEQCGVEELALQFYAGEGGGWQGVHTESGIWLTIYGLLMWDIIFADVPNVFRTKFQNAPLDMDSESFYVGRMSIIESHLQKIHDGQGEELLVMSWESHFGTVCRGVNWERHSLSELRAAVTCIGGPCLANLCRLLAQDYRSWSSGMPDLLLWRFHGDYSGEAKLVEVKGPKDRLSEQQRAWLLTLMDCGFTAEVCKVSPPAST